MKAYLTARKRVSHMIKKLNLYELGVLIIMTFMIAGLLFIIFAL